MNSDTGHEKHGSKMPEKADNLCVNGWGICLFLRLKESEKWRKMNIQTSGRLIFSNVQESNKMGGGEVLVNAATKHYFTSP